MLDNIRIVLVETFHAGNIGSAARALKTMGLSQLYLVNPRDYPSEEAVTMAAGARDRLDNCVVVDTLEEALNDCTLSIATSSRDRSFPWPQITSREAGEKVVSEAPQGNIAIVFGSETSGLSNDELRQCQFHAYIPGNEEYSVLNVASAIQIFSYEIHMASLKAKAQENPNHNEAPTYPRAGELEQFYTHLESTLAESGFLNKSHPGKSMLKLRRLFNRARPEGTELKMLRGILGTIDKLTGK
jgi:tRNA (cytidine32/uridine32-2'-O)-methyltransferase